MQWMRVFCGFFCLVCIFYPNNEFDSTLLPPLVMGSLKRKNSNFPASGAPYKRSVRDESSASASANGCAGRRAAHVSAATPSASPDPSSNGVSRGSKVSNATAGTDDDSAKDNRSDPPDSVPNASRHDQEDYLKTADEDAQCADEGKGQNDEVGCVNKTIDSETGPLIPNHAGWFSWDQIHALERRSLPEFFNSKSKIKTPTLYMDYRNRLMRKYFENPEELFTPADVATVIVGKKEVHIEAGKRIFEFLDHWGLVNSRALANGKSGNCTKQGALPSGQTAATAHHASLRSKLYRFDSSNSSSTSKPCVNSTKAVPHTAFTESTIADLQLTTLGPSVEYHCNFCQADCSKRRFHCQKQADFDLCPECYNEGKFSFGMANTDFILMEALTEGNDPSSGGWTDQETLLLLEALELYGDNFSEIAEHVATKTKAQCILHFIRLPIEDPFLEAMDLSNNSSGLQHVADSAGGSKTVTSVGQSDDQEGAPKIKLSDIVSQKTQEDDASGSGKIKNGDPQNDVDLESKNSNVTSTIIAAAQEAGLFGPEKLIAFSESGNPVMALVAYLAAIVGPDAAANSAQTALTVIAEQDSALHLADKNSFNLETNCMGKDLTSIPHDRALEGGKQLENQSTAGSIPATSGDADTGAAEGKQFPDSADRGMTGSCPNKFKKAAGTAMAAAAVKAKFLADQEEWEILRLAATIVDNQLKKVDTKLKLFRDLHVMLERERDQIEKSRQRIFAERTQLAASRALCSSSAGQHSSINAAVSLGSKLLHSGLGASSGFGVISGITGAPPFTAAGPNDATRSLMNPQYRDFHGLNMNSVRPLSLVSTPQFVNQFEIQRPTQDLSKSKKGNCHL